jgi:hypothetical protein
MYGPPRRAKGEWAHSSPTSPVEQSTSVKSPYRKLRVAVGSYCLPVRLTITIESDNAAVKTVQDIHVRIALPNKRTRFIECGSNIAAAS